MVDPVKPTAAAAILGLHVDLPSHVIAPMQSEPVIQLRPSAVWQVKATGADGRDLPLVAAYAVEPGYCQERFAATLRPPMAYHELRRGRRARMVETRHPVRLDGANSIMV